MHYIKTKKAQTSECNICGKIRKMTWDHVPPKSALLNPAVFANTLFSDLPTETAHMREYQSGIKYRTICQECNNVVLGENDKEYKAFIETIAESIKTITINHEYIPGAGSYIEIPCKINRILRAVCGHLLAAKEEYDAKVLSDVFMREYVLNEKIILEKIKVFSWIYPYSTIVISRDFICRGHYEGSHPKGFISTLSCFPISFIVSMEDETDCILDNLGQYTTETIDEVVTVKLHLDTVLQSGCKQYKNYNWPVDISDDKNSAMFVMGSSAVMEDSRIAIRK